MLHLFELTSVRDCWWHQIYSKIKKRHRKIVSVLNVSYSGSLVTGKVFPAGQSYKRIIDIGIQQKKKSPETSPGIIILCMGYNDFGMSIPPRDINPLHPNNFENAYYNTLIQLRNMYPQATILCTTLLTTTIKERPDWYWPENEITALEKYNDAIRYSAERVKRCQVVDMAKWAPSPYETLDGIHPNKTGHKQIADAFAGCLEKMGIL